MSNVIAVDARPNITAGNRPQAIVPQDMDSAYRLAKAICMAGMAPKGMETPEKCMIAIMRGMEVGLTPFMALDKIAIVNGRPTIWGDGAIGLVRGSGLCEFIREKVEGKDDTRVAVCEAKRRGEVEPIRRAFSVTDAKKAGLWGKQGPWQQYPERMLQMRARGFALRDGFADVLGGLYLREEIEDERAIDSVSRDEPPAPPQVVESAPLVAAQEPAKALAPPSGDAPSAAADPEAFVRFAQTKINEAATGEELETIWNDTIEPVRSELFPSDVDDLMSVYRKRETALNG
jgi:hypothetical protein